MAQNFPNMMKAEIWRFKIFNEYHAEWTKRSSCQGASQSNYWKPNIKNNLQSKSKIIWGEETMAQLTPDCLRKEGGQKRMEKKKLMLKLNKGLTHYFISIKSILQKWKGNKDIFR